MGTYAEDRAQFIAQAQQRQAANRVEEIKREYAQVERELDEAVADNDMETAHLRALEANQLQAEHAQYVRPQPQYHPKDVNLIQKNANYFQKYPQSGPKAALYVSNRLQQIGIPPNHPQYEDMMYRGMEYYGEKFNAPYDRNDEILTPDEAAKISGLSPKDYNKAAQEIGRQGRYSWQQKG